MIVIYDIFVLGRNTVIIFLGYKVFLFYHIIIIFYILYSLSDEFIQFRNRLRFLDKFLIEIYGGDLPACQMDQYNLLFNISILIP